MNRTALFTLAFFALITATASAGLITGVEETGTGLAPEGVYYTGQNFDHVVEGADFDVPALNEDVPFFTDRSHEWNGSTVENTIASLGLVGTEYIMMANDNRSVGDYRLDVEVGQTVDAYVMMDARVTQPAWLENDGWAHLGEQRMGIDEGGESVGAGVGINQTFIIWKKTDVSDSFVTYERGGSGNNMYGVVVTEPGVGPGYLEPPILPVIDFTYSSDGGGTISGTLDTSGAGGTGLVEFTAALPDPVFVDPNPALTPDGAVGTITEANGSHNDVGKTAGVNWSGIGPVELTGTDGVNNYSVMVDLKFGPSGQAGYNKPEEDPLSSFDPVLGPSFDYEWTIEFSDNAEEENGGDAVSTGGSDNPRMAVYLAVGREAPNGLSHRFTQSEYQFNVGPDEHVNESAPGRWTKFAAYQDLGIFFGWRDRDSLGDGSFQVDSIDFSGNLLVDLEGMTATPVPEPTTLAMLAAVAMTALLVWRRRRCAV